MPVKLPNKDVCVCVGVCVCVCVCVCACACKFTIYILACVLSVCESMSQLGVCQADRSSWVVIFDWAVEALWASLFGWCGTGLCFDLHSSGCNHSSKIPKWDTAHFRERDAWSPDVSLSALQGYVFIHSVWMVFTFERHEGITSLSPITSPASGTRGLISYQC
jgi:hypothetical protein